jgi:microcystin-dependent protein
MKKASGIIAALLASTSGLWGATLMPNGMQQFIDGSGNPIVGGRVFFYSNFPTCTIPKNTWQDTAQTVLNTNPVVLDSAGRATIFGSGAYCQVLKDANGNTIWTKYTSDTSSASNLGWGGVSGGSPNAQSLTASSYTGLDGQTVYFVAGFTNSGPMTLNINGIGSAAVLKDTPSGPIFLTGTEVTAGNVVGVTYRQSTGQFHLIVNNNYSFAGEVRMFAMPSCPAGWLPADGTAVSSATYATLFSALGTTWGTSAGNVVLPDLRGVFARGASNMNGPAGARATTPDAVAVTPQAVGSAGYQTSTNISHTHTDAGHTHSYNTPNTSATPTFQGGAGYTQLPATTGTGFANIQATGGIESRPRNYAVQYCVKY